MTRSAAAELVRRNLPLPRSQVGTLHSICFHALGRPTIAEGRIEHWNENRLKYRLQEQKGDNIDGPGDYMPTQSPGDKLRFQYDILRAQLVSRDRWPPQVTEFAEAWEAWKAENDIMDFGDLIRESFEHLASAPGAPDAILIDEVQDNSRAELELLVKWSGRARGTVFVGDSDQCIYDFRGADPTFFLRHPPDRSRVLDQSYRVPRAVHELATRWIGLVPDRIAAPWKPRDADGCVRHITATCGQPEKLVADVERQLADGRTCMVLGACGYHLDPTVAVLRKRAVPFSNPWRTTNGRWNPLATYRNRVTAAERVLAFLEHRRTGKYTVGGISKWVEVLASDGLLERGVKPKLKEERETCGGDELEGWELRAYFTDESWPEVIQATATGDLRWLASRLLPKPAGTMEYAMRVARVRGWGALEERPRCFIGSIHSVKGSEAQCVYIFPDVSPAAFAAWRTRDGQASVRRQFYVGVTRAREELVVCAPAGRMAVPL